jgi:hypothetical protein
MGVLRLPPQARMEPWIPAAAKHVVLPIAIYDPRAFRWQSRMAPSYPLTESDHCYKYPIAYPIGNI